MNASRQPNNHSGDIARVLVDTDLPHLDRLFDYRIPAGVDVECGMTVRVKMAGKRYDGWVIERSASSTFSGRLRPIENVVTAIPILTPAILDLARDLAQRNAVPLAKIVASALPDRHAGAEKAFLSNLKATREVSPRVQDHERSERWDSYPMADALFNRLQRGESPRAVWQLLPGMSSPSDVGTHPFVDLIDAVLRSQRRMLIVVPTASDVDRMEKLIDSMSEPPRVAYQRSSDSKYRRYSSFLGALLGTVDVVVGTRAAIYSPLTQLGAILILDPGDDRLTDPQAPYLSALDVAVRRAHLEQVSLIAAGMSISLSSAALVHSGWAALVRPELEAFRAQSAVVHVPNEDDRLRDGSGGLGRIPTHVQQRVRAALEEGPVLVHVPQRGWVSVVACARCSAPGRCTTCHGPLRANSESDLSCSWCSRPQIRWHCFECASSQWKSTRIGSARTAEELGRVFAGVPVTTSDSEHGLIATIDNRRRLVIATPGAEPVAENGYAAGLVLDAYAVLGRPELWAPEEAYRRWMNVLGLIRPSGSLTIVGVDDPSTAQSLIRRDPIAFVARLLDERQMLGFFPSKCIVAIDGKRDNVEEFITQVTIPQRCEPLGLAARIGRDVQKSHGSDPVRALYRCEWDAAPTLMEHIKATQISRSAKHAGMVSVRVNPQQLL
ncbi:MAG: hypothetical protein Q4P71_05835 [Actinomycetaceae bacterium]|nr:hypothetical protein [Actinomycetaceae bacterium]